MARTPGVYLKLRGPDVGLYAVHRPLPQAAFDALTDAARAAMRADGVAVPALRHPVRTQLVYCDYELRAGASAAARASQARPWVESRGALRGSVVSTYVGSAWRGIKKRGNYYPNFGGSMHYDNDGGHVPTGWPQGGMVRSHTHCTA